MKRALSILGLLAAWTWWVDRHARRQVKAEHESRKLRFYRGALVRGEGNLAERFRRAQQ